MAERRADPKNRYRDRISGETEEAFGLGNVPGLERPMASGPGDVLVGTDELGNRIYRTILGTQYTVKPNPDQRTTRGKVEDWVDEGMPLPSKDEALEMAKAIPGAMYDSMQNTLEGTATLGEAVGWAPAMGAASLPFDVPEGATRIFGGKNAAHPPTPKVNYSVIPDFEMYSEEAREAVYKLPSTSNFSDYASYFFDKGLEPQVAEDFAREAVALRSAGETVAKQNAGWSLGADGLPRFEIDDSRAVYLGQYAEVGKPTTLEAILDHGDLYYQYPELKDMPVTLKPMEGGLLGQYNPQTKEIELNSNKPPEEIKSTLLHEIQHAVQQMEGFDGGSNQIHASMFGPIYEANTPEAKKAWQDYTTEMSRFETYDFTDALSEVGKKVQKAIDEYRNSDTYTKGTFTQDFPLNRLYELAVTADLKGFAPNKQFLFFGALNDAAENPNLLNFLQNHLSEEQMELVLRLDVNNLENSPYNKQNQYKFLGVTPPVEPLFLQPNGDVGTNAFKLYRRNMGETEARNVQTRQNMTREERLANPPRNTEDIPRGFQWARPQQFAQGGLVEDQMKFAFMDQPVKLADGGMIDDGATVEPTTGNEVPPGSLKEEVADSIDAKLSVGEYVVPADVVQYYGVAHFEKLRKKAKEGLAEMEAGGRIGGDPEEDELPFSDEELMAEDYEEDGAQGFAEGGLAWNSPQMTGLANTGTEMKTYVGPDGSKLPILFINGQPIQQIPQGYTPEDQAKAQQAAFKSVRPGTGMRGQDEGQRPLNTMEAKPMNEWGVEDFERYSNSQGVMKVVSALPALLGPGAGLVGLAASKAYQMQGQKALEEIDNRLAMTDLDAQSRQRLETVKQNLSSRDNEGGGFLGGLFGGEGLLGGLTDGDGLLKNLFSGGVKTTSELPSSRPTQTGSGRTTGATSMPTSGGDSSSSTLAPTSSPRPQPNPQATSSQAPKNSTPAERETYSSSGRNNSQQVSGDPRNFAEGGLVKRRNKKK